MTVERSSGGSRISALASRQVRHAPRTSGRCRTTHHATNTDADARCRASGASRSAACASRGTSGASGANYVRSELMKLGLCISRRATGQSASAFLVGRVLGCRARPGTWPVSARSRRSGCGEETGVSHNLRRGARRERDGAGREGRHRQRAKGAGRSDIHHVFGIGEGRGVPAVRRQRGRR